MVLRKHELEMQLGEESHLIKAGVLRDDNPLESSEEFAGFLLACRQGDLKKCQEYINLGVNINGKDKFDYTPLIIASLCGHFELVQLLLEAGALAERNTFQGERCIYNALNDRIRNLLLQYDFSKSSDPYVYWSTHISNLMNRTSPATSDISLDAGSRSFNLHKFLLSSRTPYFRKKLEAQPEITSWTLSPTIPAQALQIVMRYLYLGDLPKDLVPPGSSVSEEEVAKGLDKISKQLEVEHLWEAILSGNDRRLARQRYEDEVQRALRQVGEFFQTNVVGHKMVVDTDRVDEVRWNKDNSIFADVLLRADEPFEDVASGTATPIRNGRSTGASIPIGPAISATAAELKPTRKSVLYPVHKCMLIRSEYFEAMFSNDFIESRQSDHLRVVTVDCNPAVLELILNFLYTENAACPLEHALDLLYAADMLFLDSLKNKAAVAISSLGNGSKNALVDRTHTEGNGDSTQTVEVEPINIYDVIHAAWDLRVQRLEEFAARYLADRLEDYIDELEFQELILESAQRLKNREETDSIELLDDIRYYLGERFRFRFEDVGIEELMDENGEISAEAAESLAAAAGDRAAPVQAPTQGDDGQNGAVRTIDGEEAEDEFVSDAINYQLLLEKIDQMLERIEIDA